MKCGSCGVAFLEPPTDSRIISNLLEDHYITKETHLETRFEKSRETVLSLVANHIQQKKEHGRILDLGCAGGYFLSRFFSSPSWETFGIEPSRFAAAKAREKGINVHQGQVLTAEFPAGHFDVVTALDVLSYFSEPHRELEVIRRILKPDGLLVIEQPLGDTHVWRHSTKMGRILGGSAMFLVDNGTYFLYDSSSVSLLLRESHFRPSEIIQLPPNKQRDICRNALFRAYYWASQALWRLSGRKVMLGPNFLVLATPSSENAAPRR
jgi:SAM-dependent methyltransferase